MTRCSYTYQIFVIEIVIIFCLYLVKTENYDDKPDYDGSASTDSESSEVYNISSKEKPLRMRQTKEKNKFVTGDITIDVSVGDAKSSTVKKSGKCKQTLANYPYSVSIQKKGSHYASGAIIHKQWILTVAREFYNVRETVKLFRARLGSVNCKKGGTLVPIKGIEIHPSYVFNEPSFDLAMLRIGQHIACSEFIKPISLSNVKGLIVSAKFLATYWPRLIVNGKVLEHSAKERIKQNSMRVSTQKMISWDQCYNLIETYNFTLDVSSLCLEPIISHHSSCMPDAGAPIIAEDGLWGITSGWTSNNCSTSPSPTICTRTSLEPTQSWLETLLDENI